MQSKEEIPNLVGGEIFAWSETTIELTSQPKGETVTQTHLVNKLLSTLLKYTSEL